MPDEQKLLELEPKMPVRLLEELAGLSERVAGGETLRRPTVTLHLRSGRDVSGVVLKVRHQGHAAVAALHLPGGGRTPEYDVAHVPVDSVEAVTVHDVPSLDRPPDSAAPPPGNLELRRRVAAWETSLHTQLGALISLDLPELHDADVEPLDALLKLAGAVLETLAKESLGREALRSKVERVRMAVGSLPAVTLNQRTLLVTTVHAYPRRMTAAALQAAIEAVL